MTHTSMPEWALIMLVGMGPLKAMLVFMSMTEDADLQTTRRMAATAVATAAGGAVGLLILGSALQALLHFSLGALSIGGGLILLILSVRMVLGEEEISTEGLGEKDLMEAAVSPLAIPLILSPVGIVALVTFSAETKGVAGFLTMLAVIGAVALLDLVVLLLFGRLAHHASHAVITVALKLFSVLLAALAIQLALNGLADLGLIGVVAH